MAFRDDACGLYNEEILIPMMVHNSDDRSSPRELTSTSTGVLVPGT